MLTLQLIWQSRFLSTLSLRRATVTTYYIDTTVRYFYPRSPCGERRTSMTILYWHALRFLSTLSLRRATPRLIRHGCPSRIFLSTLSLRRATVMHCYTMCMYVDISIHALLAESDLYSAQIILTVHRYFYPRSPCGERPCKSPSSGRQRSNFYPRSPCGERRCPSIDRTVFYDDFYPRSPCGERP